MQRVSIVGIDNSGKTSVVKELAARGLDTIHLTDFSGYGVAKKIADMSAWMARAGERYHVRTLAGLAYLLHFPTHKVDLESRDSPWLFSDRDPAIDALVHSEFYLPRAIARAVRPHLQRLVEGSFGYADIYVHLNVDPELAVARNPNGNQIHERVENLQAIRVILRRELSRVYNAGSDLVHIETEGASPQTIADTIQSYIRH